MGPMERMRHWRDRFYAGPAWIELPPWAVRRGYRSPTVLAGIWLVAWYLRMLSVPGRMVVAVLFLMIFYSLTIRTPIRLFGFALLGLVAADALFGLLLRPRLRIVRRLPERARADSPVRVDYQLYNRRGVPALNLFLDAIHPHSQLRHVEHPASLDALPGHGRLMVRTVMRTGRRGRYRVPAPVAVSGFPFGIVRWSCLSGEVQHLLVHPAFEPLQSLALPVSQRYQREVGSMVAKVGESLEFHGCREFRTGDNPKHIHWPSTAKADALIVREFQEEYLCRVALVTDTWVPSAGWLARAFGRDGATLSAFEAGLALTAAVADHLARGDHIIDLFAAGPEIYHFQAGRGLARLDQMLDILAGLEPNREEPVSRLAPSILEEIAEIGAAVIILLGWDEVRARLHAQLQEYGIGMKLILISEAAPEGGPPDMIHLHPDEILGGGVRHL